MISQIPYEYTLRLNRELITDEKLSCFPEGQSKKIFERKLNNDKGDYSYKYNRKNGVTAEIAPKARKNISLILTIIQLMNNNKLKNYTLDLKTVSIWVLRLECLYFGFWLWVLLRIFQNERYRISSIFF